MFTIKVNNDSFIKDFNSLPTGRFHITFRFNFSNINIYPSIYPPFK
jgi:hypothetical protein